MRDSAKSLAFLSRAHQSFEDFKENKRLFETEIPPDVQRRTWEQSLNDFRKFLRYSEMAARNMGRDAWADAMKNEVKVSPVLRYAFHARNADEHGLSPVSEPRAASMNIGNVFLLSGDNSGVLFQDNTFVLRKADGTKDIRTVNAAIGNMKGGKIVTGWIKTDMPIVETPAFLELADVVDRNVTYKVPNVNCKQTELPKHIVQNVFNWMFTKIKALNNFSS